MQLDRNPTSTAIINEIMPCALFACQVPVHRFLDHRKLLLLKCMLHLIKSFKKLAKSLAEP